MNNVEGTRQIDFVTSGEERLLKYIKRGSGDCLIKT